MSTRRDPSDPITLEIIQSSLQAISDEMFAAMRKTAMSAIIYEVLDMGTGITDAHGELASSGAGIPAFVGVLDKAVKRSSKFTHRRRHRPGDIFATNDPYYGGVTHLNDVILAMPVFAGGEIVAWTANIAHWNDVGGMVPGSMSNEAREIFQEGLRLPAIKLIDGGEPIRSVMDIMAVNCRLPDFLRATCGRGSPRCAWASGGSSSSSRSTARRRSSRRSSTSWTTASRCRGARSGPAEGRFTLAEEQDDGLVYKVTIEITDDEFIVDLRDNPDQDPGPNNASRDGAIIARRWSSRRHRTRKAPPMAARSGRCSCSPGPARSSTPSRPPRSPSISRWRCASTT